MKRFFFLFFGVIFFASGSSLATISQQQDQQQDQQPTEETPQGPQFNSQEEADAWSELMSAEDNERVQQGEGFLENFPDSEFAPMASHILAILYLESSDEEFIPHAERAVNGLPDHTNNAVLLINMAMRYLNQGKADQTITSAQKGLQMVDVMEKPDDSNSKRWNLQREQLQADGNFSIGSAYLLRWVHDTQAAIGEKNPNLAQAIQYFEKAVESDPAHEQAYFRMGECWVRQNDADNSIKSYARSAALKGAVAPLALENLRNVYGFKYPKRDNEQDKKYNSRISKAVDRLVKEEREYVQNKIAEKERSR